MTTKPDFPESDTRLDHVMESLAKILEGIASGEERLKRFLQLTGLKPEVFRETAWSPLFMLSMLDFIIKDQQLLCELAESEQIEPALIELTRARLAFEVAAAQARKVSPAVDAPTVREHFFQQLHAFLQQRRER